MSESPGNLDQIREILFGAQMREVDVRLSSMEKRLLAEMGRLREDFSKGLASMETFARSEFQRLDQGLESEQKARSLDVSSRVGDLASTMEERLSSLDQHTQGGLAALRKAMEDVTEGVRSELHGRVAELTTKVARETGDLRDIKANRSDLAGLFQDLASRLTGARTATENGEAPRSRR